MLSPVRAFRWIVIAAVGVLLVGACGADTPTIAATASADAPASAAAPVATSTSAPLEVANGRDAMLAAQGTPHILWFWGAH